MNERMNKIEGRKEGMGDMNGRKEGMN